MEKCLIAIPQGKTVDSVVRFEHNKALDGINELGLEAEILTLENYDRCHVRNEMVLTAIKNKYQYVFMMDDDMIFPDRCLYNLYRSLEIQVPVGDKRYIVSGVYCKRGGSYEQICYDYIPGKKAFESNPVKLNGSIYKRDMGGTGCLLLNVNLFEELEFPYFLTTYYGKEKVGEDVYFFEKCYKADIPVYINSGVICTHIGRFGIVPENGRVKIINLNS